MTINKAWHDEHRLGRNATMKERVAWHVAHRKACGCRPVPAPVEREIQAGAVKAKAGGEAKLAKPRAAAKPAVKRGRAAPPRKGAEKAPVVDARFAPLIDALSGERGVTYGGKGFGSSALKVDDQIFAMMSSKGEFVVKLSRARVEELVRKKEGKYFDAGRGRLMREWLAVAGSPKSWLGLAREALAFGRGG
jgi:hypothetical protein